MLKHSLIKKFPNFILRFKKISKKFFILFSFYIFEPIFLSHRKRFTTHLNFYLMLSISSLHYNKFISFSTSLNNQTIYDRIILTFSTENLKNISAHFPNNTNFKFSFSLSNFLLVKEKFSILCFQILCTTLTVMGHIQQFSKEMFRMNNHMTF
jgi:hypothetical protein